MNTTALKVGDFLYRKGVRRLLFLCSAEKAHAWMVRQLRYADSSSLALRLARALRTLTLEEQPTRVGGVMLPTPFILAAGLVKGYGFETEARALEAVDAGKNIIPGWRVMPILLGAVEFGSFTRYPRLGNAGKVLWRYVHIQSLQNRVGLKNPGCAAAASFLGKHRALLPPCFGINIALVSEVDAVEEWSMCLHFFLENQVHPSWFTLNLSCPNTEHDPQGVQTGELAEKLCRAFAVATSSYRLSIPLWVKISPGFSPGQYAVLMEVFSRAGVGAVIATNTLPRAIPSDDQVLAGMSGQVLFPHTLQAITHLMEAKRSQHSPVDVIASGGVLSGAEAQQVYHAGAKAIQYWSALVYRGIFAPSLIQWESKKLWIKK